MQNLILLSIAAVGVVAARYVVMIFIARQAYVKAMQLNGCKPVREWPHTGPFGIDHAKRLIVAIRDGYAQKAAAEDFEACGKTFKSCTMGTATIYTMEWANINAVQSLEFEKWGVEPLRKGIAVIMGNGIALSDGATWSHARKTLSPVFQNSQFEELEKRAFEKHLSRMLKRISNGGSTIDLQHLFQRMFLNTSLEYIFGETGFSDLDDSSLEGDKFVAEYDNAIDNLLRAKRIGINRALNVSGSKKFVEKLRFYIDKQIAAALKKMEAAKNAGYQDPGSKESYVFVDQLVYKTQDRDFVRDQLLNIFFQARDAPSAGASFIFFILARHPDVWNKLRSEVSSYEQPLTNRNLNSMRYLNNVINECLRLLAPADRVVRACLKDCVLPCGGGPDGSSPIYVSAGTHIDMNLGQLHKDKDLWGEYALEFRPERWESLDPKFKYQPFFAGPRKCPAQQMLVTQYRYLLVRMAIMFERIDNKDEVLEFVEEHNIAITSRNGVKVALIPARDK